MTSDQISAAKPFTHQDQTWFTPPIVVPLILVLAIVLRAIFLAQH